jgi:hypothetical protein
MGHLDAWPREGGDPQAVAGAGLTRITLAARAASRCLASRAGLT